MRITTFIVIASGEEMELRDFHISPLSPYTGQRLGSTSCRVNRILQWTTAGVVLSVCLTSLSCVREEASFSSPAAASGSIASTTTPAIEPLSPISMGRGLGAGIATMIADTDGDGELDIIEVCSANALCIQHPSKSTLSTTYSDPLWESLSLIAVEDTDGEPGAEVILLALNAQTGKVCVCVVHDRTTLMEPYSDTRWRTVRVAVVVDTNNVSGKEIVLFVREAEGTLMCVCIIDDRQHTIRPYIKSSWHSIQLGWIDDTDGLPGNELVLEAHDVNGNLVCVCLIHDQDNRLTVYSDTSWKSGAIALTADTDGQPGMEVIVAYPGYGAGGIAVISDRTEDTRTYTFFEDSPAIQQVGNFDTAQGVEICVYLSHQREYTLIVDRGRQEQAVHDCQPPGLHKINSLSDLLSQGPGFN